VRFAAIWGTPRSPQPEWIPLPLKSTPELLGETSIGIAGGHDRRSTRPSPNFRPFCPCAGPRVSRGAVDGGRPAGSGGFGGGGSSGDDGSGGDSSRAARPR